MSRPFSGWSSTGEARALAISPSTGSCSHSATIASAPAVAASTDSATTRARWSASHRETSHATFARPVCRAHGDWSDQDRLVPEHQSVLVDGDVGRGNHLDHSRDRQGRAHIHSEDAGMGLVGEDDPGMKEVLAAEVGRVQSGTGHLVGGIDPPDEDADRRHGPVVGAGGHRPRCLLDRRHDLVVAGAAAEVAREGCPDLVGGRAWFLLQQLGSRHDESGDAEAALDRTLFEEGLLEGMQSVSPARPSIVAMSAPCARPAGTRQDMTAMPSRNTVQAPHSPSAHPSLEPVRPAWSRSQSSSVPVPAGASSRLPLTLAIDGSRCVQAASCSGPVGNRPPVPPARVTTRGGQMVALVACGQRLQGAPGEDSELLPTGIRPRRGCRRSAARQRPPGATPRRWCGGPVPARPGTPGPVPPR